MKKLNKTVCGTCEAGLDISELEPFTQFKCPGCGTELYAPAALGHLRFDIPRGNLACFKVFDGFDAKKNLYVNLLCRKLTDNCCDLCTVKNVSQKMKEVFNQIQKVIHPNICPVIGLWEITDYMVITSPLMDGFDLSEYNPEQYGLLNLEKTLLILQKAAVGLAAAHQKGIIHHNICPANLHIDLRGNIRWKNFFAANFIYYHCQNPTFRSQIADPNFASPEKLASKNENKKGDIFSFGASCYFLLTGKYPFAFPQDSPPNQISEAYKKPPPPCELRNDLSKQVSDVILSMLSFDENERASLAEFISAVNIFLAEIERDRIYESQWKMIVSSTDTRQIPKMEKIGFKAEDFYPKKDQNKSVFNIKSLTEPDRRK